jgi:hypothetical protein
MLYGLLSIAAARGERAAGRESRNGLFHALQAMVLAIWTGLLRLFAPGSPRKR